MNVAFMRGFFDELEKSAIAGESLSRQSKRILASKGITGRKAAAARSTTAKRLRDIRKRWPGKESHKDLASIRKMVSKYAAGPGETLAGIKQPKESFERFIGQTSGKEKMDYEKTLKEGIMKDPLTPKKALGGAAPLPQRQGPAQ